MVKDWDSVRPTHQCALLWILFFCHRLSADILRRNIYFVDGDPGVLSMPQPPLGNGTEFSWEWTPHLSGQGAVDIITLSKNSQQIQTRKGDYNFWIEDYSQMSTYKHFQKAGIYSFRRKKPTQALLAQFEVFGVKISPFTEHPVGFDMYSKCEISHLPKSVTLRWEKEGDPSANTTLLYNSSAYIIIHSARLQDRGQYACSVRERESRQLLFTASAELSVSDYTYRKQSTLYRVSSNASDVELTCQSGTKYSKATWSRTRQAETTPEELASAARGQPPDAQRKSDGKRFSFSSFDGSNFPLRIAPLIFEDGGVYTCKLDGYNYAQVTLVNIQVSVEPPGGVSRYQPVVLTCRVSEVPEMLTVAWLRIEGSRAVLVKQEVLAQSMSVRYLSLSLPELTGDQLLWECAVFGSDMLRARAPLRLTLPPGNNMAVIISVSVCAAVLCAGLLTAVLLLYCRRRATAATGLVTSPQTHIQSDAVYYEVTDQQEVEDKPAGSPVLYSAISLGASRTDQKKRPRPEPDSEGETGNVVYSVLRI